jgi:hypothetical protein
MKVVALPILFGGCEPGGSNRRGVGDNIDRLHVELLSLRAETNWSPAAALLLD